MVSIWTFLDILLIKITIFAQINCNFKFLMLMLIYSMMRKPIPPRRSRAASLPQPTRGILRRSTCFSSEDETTVQPANGVNSPTLPKV